MQGIFERAFADIIGDASLFYTDGSKKDEGTYVGSAIYSPQAQIQLMYRLPSHTLIFSAKAWVIYNAVILLYDLNIDNAVIITDSNSMLDALRGSSPKTGNYFIPQIKTQLEAAQERRTLIRFIWIPAHRGIRGNEIANDLAKRAVREEMAVRFEFPFSVLFSHARLRLNADFEIYLEHWSRIKGVLYFEKIYCKSKRPWFYSSSLNRGSIATIS